MTYTEAIQWRENNKNLIGTTDEKGFIVSDLFVVPANPNDRDIFLRNYLFSENKEAAIQPYINDDVQVWSVDLARIESDNILFYNVLAI